MIDELLDWEEALYRKGRATLRREDQERLEALDDRWHVQARRRGLLDTNGNFGYIGTHVGAPWQTD